MRHPGKVWFNDTVSALAYSLAQRFVPGYADPKFQPPYNDVARFILRQHGRMTDYLRLPMFAATIGFDAAAALSRGKVFHHLDPPERAEIIARWKRARLSVRRDLIRFYESLAVIGLFERDRGQSKTCQVQAEESRPAGLIETPARSVRVEVVVVGSGPAGAITAALLAEHGKDVLLVEDGPFLPLESCPPFSRIEMEQKYRNGGLTVALGRTKIAYVEARCVGGGSEINSGLYHRTPPDVLEQWRKQFDVDGLTERDLVQHFEACERDLSVSFLCGPVPAASLKLRDGAARLGWHSLEVPRWFKLDPLPNAPWHGIRQSMTKTYLPRFLKAGGKLLPDTRVNKLKSDGTKCSVDAIHKNGVRLQIRADTVFVCAGAVQTPALLLRSGIVRNVGNSLCVHPTVKVVAEFADPVNAPDMGVPVHQVKEFAPRFSFGCSISSPAYIALGLIEYPEQISRVPNAWERMANYYAMIVPDGRGTIRPVPGFRDPIVRYSLTGADYRTLGEALHKLCELLFAAGAVAIYPSVSSYPALTTRDDVLKLPEELPARLTNLMTIHLFSSCPMGEDKARCAVDSFGRVHGFKNLFVNDASLLCSAPGVNPQGTIMALARRNTLKFLGKL